MNEFDDSREDLPKYCPQPTLDRVATMNIFDTNCEAHQILEHIANPTVPPKVEYSLTPLGKSLVEPLAVMGEWAYQHIQDVKVAIEDYTKNSDLDDYWKPK
jgi:hypothetical protein